MTTKEYYWKHRDEILRKNREYYFKNLEKCKENHRNWRRTNREKMNEYQKKWAKNNPKKRNAQTLMYNNLEKYPLDDECAFCPRTRNLEHGHIDYDYPEIYLTVCHQCNQWMGIEWEN